MSLPNIPGLATEDSLPLGSATALVKKMILEQGPLPWSEVMRMALYDPAVGYYGSQVRKIGRQGDFYTAVSVGPVYGALLAEVTQRVWMAAGEPGEFIVAEQAGHDGQLAEDVWTAAAGAAGGQCDALGERRATRGVSNGTSRPTSAADGK